MKLPQDNPTIGLLICKSKNNIVARYTLDTANLPIGISEYELKSALPKRFQSTLPSIEEIENELKRLDTYEILRHYSCIQPSDEVDELLQSLTEQSFKDFEVVISGRWFLHSLQGGSGHISG